MDTDEEIERTMGMSIPEIFRKYGEKRFRGEETQVVKKILNMRNKVISTGRGLPINPDNWLLLEEIGIIVHLYAKLEEILSRAGQGENRPLLKQSRNEIQALLASRMPIYNKAAVSVETTGKDPSDIVKEILEKLE
jgi:shikimate kinase